VTSYNPNALGRAAALAAIIENHLAVIQFDRRRPFQNSIVGGHSCLLVAGLYRQREEKRFSQIFPQRSTLNRDRIDERQPTLQEDEKRVIHLEYVLGKNWNTRIIVVPGREPVTSGPYRYVRHPNYVAVALEIVCVPLIRGLVITALIFNFGNTLLLDRRIRLEERALGETYRRAFASHRRFIPRFYEVLLDFTRILRGSS